MSGQLRRSLGVFDAVMIGLGSMIGAGIFAALAPAARAAGSGLLIGLALAAVVAFCNATSSARLAARYPASGGTYVYGRERLGAFWGYLAGWGFVVGKTASCAAMALTVGVYAWPAYAHEVAVAAVVALTAINYVGVHKSARLTRVIVVAVLAVLAAVVVAVLGSGAALPARLALDSSVSVGGVLQAAGLLFFAFAGYARIATLAEEVRDPARVIPRAILIALAIALGVYAVVAVAVMAALGPDRLAVSAAPLLDAVRAAGVAWLVPVVGAGAAVAALGSLLALILGRIAHGAGDGARPSPAAALAAVHPRYLGAAPGRTGGRCRGGGAGRRRRYPWGDRVFVVRGTGVLRDRQCIGVHVAAHRRGAAAVDSGLRAAGVCHCWPSRCHCRRCSPVARCCWLGADRIRRASGHAACASEPAGQRFGRPPADRWPTARRAAFPSGRSDPTPRSRRSPRRRRRAPAPTHWPRPGSRSAALCAHPRLRTSASVRSVNLADGSTASWVAASL